MKSMKKKKRRFWSKTLKMLSIILPISSVLIYFAISGKIEPDYIIYDTDISDLRVFDLKNDYFVYVDSKTPKMSGIISFNEELDTYGIIVNSKDIIKVGKVYYSYLLKDNVMSFQDITQITKETKQGGNVMGVGIGITVGIALVGWVFNKKSKWEWKQPKISIFIGLIVGTILLTIINTLVSDILLVFMIATGSWGSYLLTEFVFDGDIRKEKKELILTQANNNILA